MAMRTVLDSGVRRRQLLDPRAIAALLARSAHTGRQLITIETDRHGETVAFLERKQRNA